MTTNSEFTIKNVTDILNWYALEGIKNWGTWGNYPKLPIGASYHSFDTCHLRITLKGNASFKGETFNCISDSHHVPGNNLNVININTLVDLCKENGVEFANEHLTLEKAEELRNLEIENAHRVVREFKEMATYQWQETKVRAQIERALNNIIVAKEFGKPIPEKISGYELKIQNYCEKKEVTLIVDLIKTGSNSKKTSGYYKAEPIDIEAVIELFTEEKVATHISLLEMHEKSLNKLLSI